MANKWRNILAQLRWRRKRRKLSENIKACYCVMANGCGSQ